MEWRDSNIPIHVFPSQRHKEEQWGVQAFCILRYFGCIPLVLVERRTLGTVLEWLFSDDNQEFQTKVFLGTRTVNPGAQKQMDRPCFVNRVSRTKSVRTENWVNFICTSVSDFTVRFDNTMRQTKKNDQTVVHTGRPGQNKAVQCMRYT